MYFPLNPVVPLRLAWRLLSRLPSGNSVWPRCDVRNVRRMRHLATGGVGHVDAGVVQKQAGSAIQFNARFFVSRFR